MKKQPVVIAVAWLAAVLGAGWVFADDESLVVRDSVVAVVNQKVITLRDILDRSGSALADLDRDNSLSEDERQRRKTEINSAVLRQIVAEKLLVAEGNRLLNANEDLKKHFDENIENQLQEDRRHAGGDAALRDALRKKALTYQDYADQVRERTLVDYVRFEFVMRDLSVAPREILEYYQQNLNQFEEPAQVKFRAIFIRADQDAGARGGPEIGGGPPGAAQEAGGFRPACEGAVGPARGGRRAMGLHGAGNLAEAGGRPAVLASAGRDRRAGGDGDAGASQTTESGFLIVKVEERKPARTRAFEEVQRPIEEHAAVAETKRAFRRADAPPGNGELRGVRAVAAPLKAMGRRLPLASARGRRAGSARGRRAGSARERRAGDGVHVLRRQHLEDAAGLSRGGKFQRVSLSFASREDRLAAHLQLIIPCLFAMSAFASCSVAPFSLICISIWPSLNRKQAFAGQKSSKICSCFAVSRGWKSAISEPTASRSSPPGKT